MEFSESHDTEETVFLCVDGEKFECHKSTLAEKSDYFQAMFQSKMKESLSNQIELKGISSESLKILLEIMVTGELDINKDNIEHLTEASCMFQVTSVIQHCTHYLINSINHDNCLSIMYLAEAFSLNEVYNQSRCHVLWYFTEVCKTQEFLHLEKEHIIELFSEKMLNVESELVVYDALEKWILEDKTSRKCLFIDLMKCLHVEDLRPEELDILHSQMQLNFPDSCEKIYKTMAKSDFGSKKKFRQIPDTLISVGGEMLGEDRSTPFQELLRYDIEKCVFEQETVADLSEVHTSPGTDIGYRVCVKGKDIIFTGGETKLGKNTWIVDVWKYDTFAHQWEVITQLPSVRRHHGMCVIGDSIYLMGGFGKYRVKLDSVETFNCKTGEWKTLSSLPESAFSLSATVYNGKIYAFKSRVYCYDPEEDSWKIHNGDPPPFISSDALTYGKYIYLPSRYCCRLMRYDTKSSTFEEVGNFPHSKAAGSSIICNGKIYRVGVSKSKNFMEWYDLENDKFGSTQELNMFLLNNHLISVPYIKDFV